MKSPPSRFRAQTLLLIGVFAIGPTFAAEPSLVSESPAPVSAAASAPTAPSAPVAQPYNDRPPVTVTTTTYEGFGMNAGQNGSSVDGMMYLPTTTFYHTPTIFYPGKPPILGDERAASLADWTGPFRPRFRVPGSLPPGLSSHLYEPFYAPLSTFFASEELSKRRRAKLDGYVAARSRLLAELHDRVDALAHATPPERVAALEAFARQQHAGLVALEATAEDLRKDFTTPGLLDNGVDWNETRDWRLGDDLRWESRLDEMKVARSYAFFQAGLSTAQRYLLRELAAELADPVTGSPGYLADAAPTAIYFSPETARIPLPRELPQALASKVAAYLAKKGQLKKELREALYRQDRAIFGFRRSAALRKLAEQQAPLFAEVETLAEDIRRGLAPLPNPARPATPALPPALAQRAAVYLEQKRALNRALSWRTQAMKAALPGDRVEIIRLNGTLTLDLVAARGGDAALAEKRRAIRADLVTFNAEVARTQGQLEKEKGELSAQIGETAKNLSPANQARTVDQLLGDFVLAYRQQARWERYRDYELAALEPGLSPPQRRLLFGAALEQLNVGTE